ncbi:MAG: aspartic peptidase domain-containing protein [Monoraphidium minutum]|nr:MAG: aspartic peptidase domain-containing protein [Monoraphidium minutum]
MSAPSRRAARGAALLAALLLAAPLARAGAAEQREQAAQQRPTIEQQEQQEQQEQEQGQGQQHGGGAAAHWAPLTLVPGFRAGVRGGGHPGDASKRMLREAAFEVDGSTRLGYYTAPFQLGSPPRRFDLILDTGSSVTTVPCQKCNCGYQQGPRFDPEASSTSKGLTCADSTCPKDKAGCAKKTAAATCEFSNRYADGDTNGGVIVSDTLLMPRPGGEAPEALPGFVFGCSTYVSGLIYKQYVDGLAGLSHGAAGLPTQLAAAGVGGRGGAAPGTFALCLSRRGGALAIGAAPRAPGAPTLQYAPLVPSTWGFYQLAVARVAVAGVPLELSQTAFAPSSPESGFAFASAPGLGRSIIVDSGSTYSYFAPEAYRAMVSRVTAAVAEMSRAAAPGGTTATAGAGREPAPRRLVNRPGGRRRLKQVSQRIATTVLVYGGAEGDDYDTFGAGFTGSASGGVPGSNKLKAAAAGAVTVTQLDMPARTGDVCWSLTGPGVAQIKNDYDLGGVFPEVEIEFDGGAVYRMPPYRYVHITLRTKGNAAKPPLVTACLGIFQGEGESILGAIAMREALFEFDWVSGKRLGFADTDCDWIRADMKAPKKEAAGGGGGVTSVASAAPAVVAARTAGPGLVSARTGAPLG